MASVRPTRALPARAARASCRLTWYIRALEGGARSSWRLPFNDVQRLIREGAFAFNDLRKAGDETAFRGHLENLEVALDKLSRADDWTRRLRDLLKRLDTPTAKSALTKLVRLGCVPDAIDWCLQEQAQPSERVWRKRRDSVQKRRLKVLAGEFERLADACESSFVEADRVHIDRLVRPDTPNWLRREAARFRDAMTRLDLRLKPTMRAESSLFETISNIKTITGKFHDELLVDILSETSARKGIRPEALRRWRSRQARMWKTRPWSQVEDSYRTLIHRLASHGRS